MTISTQVKHPWRTSGRSFFQGFIAFAAIAPGIYTAATQHDVPLTGGFLVIGLGILTGVTRVMALPGVDAFLTKFAPFLATQPVAAFNAPDAPAVPAPS